MSRNFETVLYHGTVSEINYVDVTRGRERKDFGKGFYMAVSKNQAIGMMNKKYRECVRRSISKKESDFTKRLYEITLDENVLQTLRIKAFEEAHIEWLDFVLMCREKGGMPHDYDVVIGPTADDDTALCLKSYWNGLYGKIGSISSKEILLRNLEVENLGIQYYIGKQEIVDRLIREVKTVNWREP